MNVRHEKKMPANSNFWIPNTCVVSLFTSSVILFVLETCLLYLMKKPNS